MIKLSILKEGGLEKPVKIGPTPWAPCQAAKCTLHHDVRGEHRGGLHGRGGRVLSFSVAGG